MFTWINIEYYVTVLEKRKVAPKEFFKDLFPFFPIIFINKKKTYCLFQSFKNDSYHKTILYEFIRKHVKFVKF